ncbi:lamin tail domain-containing protein 2 isoform X1 [Monodelphis domestica]|uniref:lamin tail domain-containing protein 2 isoform X1 n=1 Tax=Monodelphis domestica TaxID=13616 RepID=UPI0024E1C6EB|nr:lamin tail domain-containing protein 2 isoform X1 [Monodelphis domestica]XP_056657025.1 lamin tail domain-containing protein 2 isoform X1 [Monodelphis domestica]XP_056657026.1 lamin tail domain-containing protein 2 isoform X1 [Monodelphis domestica]XP_056657027.1 lamin tail domain-containing protein 2 isoform X1 [Monodelphis domestica]
MAGQPVEEIFSLECLGSDGGQELRVHNPSWTISWPSILSSDLVGTPDSATTFEGADGLPSSASLLMSPNAGLGLHLEHANPRLLKLLLAQRDLEIQSLREAARCPAGKRMNYILRVLTDAKPDRSGAWEPGSPPGAPPRPRRDHSPHRAPQDQLKDLQQQMEKMTEELKGQKERADQEKLELEAQLKEAKATMQQLEDELLSFQRSCLLHLARTSWAGRVLRSQTGSVEVVTAEALMMDVSDESLELSSSEGQHFRLEDVDWNSVAHRYPNLFEDISKIKHRPTSAHVLDPPDYPEAPRARREQFRFKSVDWSLPLPQKSASSTAMAVEGSSAGSNSMSTAGGLETSPSLVLPVQEEEASSSGPHTALDGQRPGSCLDRDSVGAAVVGIGLSRQSLLSSSLRASPSWRKDLNSSLKIVKIDKHGKFIQVLNESLEESVDIGGFVLQQLIQHFPVCIYRFPKDTLLAPQHHVTVWGEGVSPTRKRMAKAPQKDLIHFYTHPGCVTLLLNPAGEVMSQYQAPHCVTEASKAFTDYTDMSIDCYPLREAPDTKPQEAVGLRTKSHRRHLPARKKPKIPGPPPSLEGQAGPYRSRWDARPPPPLQPHEGASPATSTRPEPHSSLPRPRPLRVIPSINANRPGGPAEAREAALGRQDSCHGAMVPLPSIPELSQLPAIGKKIQKCIFNTNQFLPPRICRKYVDVECPMVALSVQKTAESRFGLKHLNYPPIAK